jgi:MscS family membrane protein
VDNYGKRKYRRWKTHLNLTYDTPPDKIEAFCEGIRELIRLHPYTRKDYYQIWLHQFGPHSLDVLIYVFWKTPDWQTELRERHRLMLDFLRLADRLGVEFAFPTQTLHVFKEEAGGEHEPSDVPEKAVDFRAQRAGRVAARELTANAGWRERKPPPYRFRGAGETADEDKDDETQIESKVGGDA